MSVSTTKKRSAAADSYLSLVRRFPLRPLRTKADYEAASKLIDKLAMKDEAELDRGEQDYLETLSLLVEAYDDEHFAERVEDKSPLEVLRYLMSESGMKVGDLAKVIGNQTAASLVLSGQRELSKAHIVRLADYFHVEPGLVLKVG
jgi:HTH-type transcriptional regulator/antitoxin HigA